MSRFLAVLSDSEPWHLTNIFECLMAFLLCALVQCMVSQWQVPYDISPENTGGVSNVRPLRGTLHLLLAWCRTGLSQCPAGTLQYALSWHGISHDFSK